MSFSRRSFLAAGAVVPALGGVGPTLAAKSAGQYQASAFRTARAVREDLMEDAMMDLRRLFPWPSSTNMQMGFSMRNGMMREELGTYVRVYARRHRRWPNPDHLFAAGEVIYRSPHFWKSRPNAPRVVTEETFAQVCGAANNCLASSVT